MVESRRGGGGCLKIKKIHHADGLVEHTIELTGDSLDEKTARGFIQNLVRQQVIDEKTERLILSAVTDNALNIEQPARDKIRANIMKNMLHNL